MAQEQDFPLLSIIALVYNQASYLQKALESVIFQDYPNIELLIVDDASTDSSPQKIQTFIEGLDNYFAAFQEDHLREARKNMRVEFWENSVNQGNCSSFNRAFQESKGEYIIDLAGDDILLPERATQQIQLFQTLDDSYGVVFSNALWIDAEGRALGYQYPIDAEGKAKIKPPQGDVWEALLNKHFISSPTMMIRRELLEELGGYDESLSYEDFDFWIRSAPQYHYAYLDEVSTQKRILKGSHSQGFYLPKHNPHLASTLKVLKKATVRCRNERELKALRKNAAYHYRQCLFTQNQSLMPDYEEFMQGLTPLTFREKLWKLLGKSKVNLRPLYQLYRRLQARLKGLRS